MNAIFFPYVHQSFCSAVYYALWLYGHYNNFHVLVQSHKIHMKLENLGSQNPFYKLYIYRLVKIQQIVVLAILLSIKQ